MSRRSILDLRRFFIRKPTLSSTLLDKDAIRLSCGDGESPSSFLFCLLSSWLDDSLCPRFDSVGGEADEVLKGSSTVSSGGISSNRAKRSSIVVNQEFLSFLFLLSVAFFLCRDDDIMVVGVWVAFTSTRNEG